MNAFISLAIDTTTKLLPYQISISRFSNQGEGTATETTSSDDDENVTKKLYYDRLRKIRVVEVELNHTHTHTPLWAMKDNKKGEKRAMLIALTHNETNESIPSLAYPKISISIEREG